jgi:F-type H+-transporting ATPase subunit delta
MSGKSNPRYLNIARPYALAAFEYAREHQAMSAWQSFLESAVTIVEDANVRRILNNPAISTSQLFHLFDEILAPQLSVEQKNFLQLLAQNKRLNVLPEIAIVFSDLCTALAKMSNVRVTTAVATDDDFKQLLTESLSKRIQHNVTLQTEIDPTLIGGAVIQMGDHVIDGSVRGKLSRLLQNLTG